MATHAHLGGEEGTGRTAGLGMASVGNGMVAGVHAGTGPNTRRRRGPTGNRRQHHLKTTMAGQFFIAYAWKRNTRMMVEGTERKRETERERQRERERQKERQRQTERVRERDREKETERVREGGRCLLK